MVVDIAGFDSQTLHKLTNTQTQNIIIMDTFNLTEEEVKQVINLVFAENESTSLAVKVKLPDHTNGSMVVSINGGMYLSEINAIGELFGNDDILIDADEREYINLFLIPRKEPDVTSEENQELHEDQEPHIELHHKDRFKDVEELVIPGTETRVGHTEMCEQIMAWVKQSGRYPLYWQRLDDGVHVEVSELADERIKHVLEQREAVGLDGVTYAIKFDPATYEVSLTAMGGSICAKAEPANGGSTDWYGLDFFI